MAKKQTLAEQIAELSKPENPDWDIEDAERGVFDHAEHDDEESGADLDDEELKSEHYVSVGKSKLRQNGIELRGEKYKGKTSSRKAIFEESDDGDDDEESGSEEGSTSEEEQSGVSEEEQSQSEDEKMEEEDEDQSESEGVVDSEEEEEQQFTASLTDSEEGSSSDESEPFTEDESTDTHKRDKLKQLMSQERKVIVGRLSSALQTEALKGYAVVSQQKQFDNILDARMKIHKALQSSNALPLDNETFEEYQEDETSDLQNKATKAVHKLLDTILTLRTSIYNKEKLTKEKLQYTSKKRSLSEYLTETSKLDTILEKNRDSVLTKWSHKVQSASGAQALNASKFKALNQGAAQQVSSNLVDMDRLVKRTRVNRRNVVPLGRVEAEKDEEEEEAAVVDRSLKEDADVFDDEDFYTVLLRDLLNKKISDKASDGGLIITKTKVKKNVDTKASKGRKLKYTVQEPIQGYDAPRASYKWDDEQIDDLFAGLLGQKVDFDEGSSDEDEEDEEKELLKEDGLKLFG